MNHASLSLRQELCVSVVRHLRCVCAKHYQRRQRCIFNVFSYYTITGHVYIVEPNFHYSDRWKGDTFLLQFRIVS